MEQSRGDDILSLDEIKSAIESTINLELDYSAIHDCASFQAIIHQLNGWRDYLTEQRKEVRGIHTTVKHKLREAETEYRHKKNRAVIRIKADDKSLSIDIVKAKAEVEVEEYDNIVVAFKTDEDLVTSVEDHLKDIDRLLSDLCTSARKTADFLRDEYARAGQNRKY